MAAAFDVAGRLSEGDHALTVLDDYVAACQVLGLPPSVSLQDLYRAESGLDLAALAADARSLDAAATAAQDALRMQGNGYRELTAQWSGAGGDAAGAFLRTLAIAAEDVVAHLRRSARALTILHDELWRAVDTKVDAVLRADAQTSGHRDEWTAAAHAVLGGVGDAAAASEIVDQQVKPFVLRVVFGELAAALQTASDAVVAAYDSANSAATPGAVSFGFPGQVLAPVLSASAAAGPRDYPAVAPPTLGAAALWSAPPAAQAGMPATSGALLSESPATTSAAPEPALGTSATASPVGAATPPADVGFGSGVGGLGQQLVDAIGGVLGSMAGLGSGAAGLGGVDDLKTGLAEDLGLDDEAAKGDVGDDEGDKDEPEPDDKPDDTTNNDADELTPDDGVEQPVDQPPGELNPPVVTAAPVPLPDPAPVTPPVEPLAEHANPTTRTPCEIAADELPNVGE
ncbi:hypothetical protein [Mycolicibacterium aubagnense]|nr:hypothetical protein [Mycolicibacterium aubagnense]